MNNIETMMLTVDKALNVMEAAGQQIDELKAENATLRQAIEQAQKREIVPLIIEDKFVRNYLWERGLVAVEDRCMRSHPHEKMNEYCQHKTNLARLMNKEAQDDARKNT